MKKLLILFLPIIFLFAFASPAKAQCEIGANIIYNNPGYFALLRGLYPDCPTITVTTMVAPAFILEHEDVFLEWLNAAHDSGIALNLRIDPMGPIGTAEAEGLGYILGRIFSEDPNSPIVGLIFNNEPNLIPGYSSAEYVASLLAFYTGYLNFFSDNPETPIPDNLTLYIAPISVGAPNTNDYLLAIAAMLADHPEINDINLAMNLYVPVGSDPAAYAALVQAQIDIFAQAGIDVSNIFISEIGLLGPDGTPIEDFSDYTQEEIEGFLTALFAEIWDVLAPYGLDGVTASFFFDSDGDGIPDQTWLVIVLPDGTVQIIKFDDLKLGVCVMEYIMNGGDVDTDALSDTIDSLQAGESIDAEDICQGSEDFDGCVAAISDCILYNFFLEIGEPCTATMPCPAGDPDCAAEIRASITVDGHVCGVSAPYKGSASRSFEKDEISATARVDRFRVPFVREIAQWIAGTPWSENQAFANGILLTRLGWWSGLTPFWRPTTSAFDAEKEWEIIVDGKWVAGRIFGTDRRDEDQGRQGRGGVNVIWRAAKEIEFALGRPGLYDSYAQRTGGLAYKNQNSEFRIQNSESSPYRHPERSEGSPSGNEILRPSTEPVLSEVEGLGAQNDNSCVLGKSSTAKLPEFETRLIEEEVECEDAYMEIGTQLFPNGDGTCGWSVCAIPHGDNADLQPVFPEGGINGFVRVMDGQTRCWYSASQGGHSSNFDIACGGAGGTANACVTIKTYSQCVREGSLCCEVTFDPDTLEVEEQCPGPEPVPPSPPGGPSCNALLGPLSKFCVNANSYRDISGASGAFGGGATAYWDCEMVENEFGELEEECSPQTDISVRTEAWPIYSHSRLSCDDNILYTIEGELDQLDQAGESLERGFYNNFRPPTEPEFDWRGANGVMNAGVTFNACGRALSSGTSPRSAYLLHLGGIYQTMHKVEGWITPPIDEWEGLVDKGSYPLGKEETLKAKAEEAKKTQMSQKIVQNPAPKETFLTKLGSGFGNLLASVISQ